MVPSRRSRAERLSRSSGLSAQRACLSTKKDRGRLNITGTVFAARPLSNLANPIRSGEVPIATQLDAVLRSEMWVFNRDFVGQVARAGPGHIYPDPEQFTVENPLGRFTGVTGTVRMSAISGRAPTHLPRSDRGSLHGYRCSPNQEARRPSDRLQAVRTSSSTNG